MPLYLVNFYAYIGIARVDSYKGQALGVKAPAMHILTKPYTY